MRTSTAGLSGKRALVTGAARGIGAAIALKLAEDGADIAITYEKSATQAEAVGASIRALGRKGVAIQADAANAEAVQAAVGRTVAHLGGLDQAVCAQDKQRNERNRAQVRCAHPKIEDDRGLARLTMRQI